MTTTSLFRLTAIAACAAVLGACASTEAPAIGSATANASTRAVTLQQIRNATIKLEYAGTTFLVDPMLARKGAYPGFEGTVNSHLRNPLVELPTPVSEVLKADAVIVTHTHPDHWDEAAKTAVPKNMPIFAQNEEDAANIRKDGFTDVRVLSANTEFKGTRLTKTAAQHGTEQMYAMPPLAKVLGQSTGVVFSHPGYKTTYVAGDTIWTRHVEDAIKQHRPDVIVLNTGYARITGVEGSIIMGKDDLWRAYQLAPKAKIIGSHMESVNHMTQSRKDLRDFIAEKAMDPQRVLVPADGESYRF
jgi:L-ascorbate metabolism protein UlaG (beta-lactamase superfamily)